MKCKTEKEIEELIRMKSSMNNSYFNKIDK